MENKNYIKIPICYLQPSKFLLDSDVVSKMIMNIEDYEDICIPIKTIGKKIVVIDNHSALKALYEEGYESVYVYESSLLNHTEDFLYICLEDNIKSIEDVKMLGSNEYTEIYEGFCKQYYLTK